MGANTYSVGSTICEAILKKMISIKIYIKLEAKYCGWCDETVNDKWLPQAYYFSASLAHCVKIQLTCFKWVYQLP